jgi:hypothetical protein
MTSVIWAIKVYCNLITNKINQITLNKNNKPRTQGAVRKVCHFWNFIDLVHQNRVANLMTITNKWRQKIYQQIMTTNPHIQSMKLWDQSLALLSAWIMSLESWHQNRTELFKVNLTNLTFTIIITIKITIWKILTNQKTRNLVLITFNLYLQQLRPLLNNNLQSAKINKVAKKMCNLTFHKIINNSFNMKLNQYSLCQEYPVH